MRKAIFTLLLLTASLRAGAQQDTARTPVRLIVTADYQRSLLGYDPLWRRWSDGSLSRALSYIAAWREELGRDRVVLVNVGAEVESTYRLYPRQMIARIRAYAGYADSTALLPADELERVAAGLAPFGTEIAVVDFTAPGVYTARAVDISGFPADAAFEERFAPLADSIQAFYDSPIALLAAPASQAGFLFGPTAYTGLFHRFQLEATGADVSFFAVPRPEEGIPAGEVTFGDLARRFRYDNTLEVVAMTGGEIVRYLEYAYGLRYNTLRASSGDLLRTSRDRDGVLRTRSAPHNLDEAAGIRYEVDVTRPAGRRVRVASLADGTPFDPAATYRVALNSHRIASGYLARATGLSEEQIAERRVNPDSTDYRLRLREWLSGRGQIAPASLDNWHLLPEPLAAPAIRREQGLF